MRNMQNMALIKVHSRLNGAGRYSGEVQLDGEWVPVQIVIPYGNKDFPNDVTRHNVRVYVDCDDAYITDMGYYLQLTVGGFVVRRFNEFDYNEEV